MSGTGEHSTRMAIISPPSWPAHEVVELAAPDLSAHVIASVEPVVAGTTPEELASDYATLLERILPDYAEISLEPLTLAGGRAAVLRTLRWKPPEGEEVTQLQTYAIEADRACVATATAQTVAFGALEQELRRALEEIRIDGAAGVEIPAVQEGFDETAPYDGSEPVSITVDLSAEGDSAGAMPVDAWTSVRERFGGR